MRKVDRYIVIGDVHGCTSELMQLIDLLQPTAKDHIIWAGDLVDKGPDSAGVVKIARNLADEIPTTLVEGNHENKHRRFRKHMDAGATDRAFQLKGAEEIYKITKRLSDEDKAFLDRAVLYAKIPEHNVLVTHGGVAPSFGELPPFDIDAVSRHSKKRWYLQFLRLRYVDGKGNMVSLGEEKPTDKFWADIYDGRFGKVMFGHQPYVDLDSPKMFPHAVGLDLGCVFGNKLAAAVITNSNIEYVTVQALAKYAKSYGED